MSVFAILMAVVTMGPVHYLSVDNTQTQVSPVGESEAIAPVAIGGAFVAGSAIGAVGGYIEGLENGRYFDDADSAIVEDLNTTKDNVTDETLRETVHSNAIVSEGVTEGFLDNVDNDQNTIEGQVNQQVQQRYIKLFDDENKTNITSEAEAVSEAESAAGAYLNTTYRNLETTGSFHTLSVKQYKNNLELAGYSEDIGAGEVFKVDNFSQAGSSDARSNADIIVLNNDISFSDSGDLVKFSDRDAIIDMNGYNITSTVSSDYGLSGDSANITVINGGKFSVPIQTQNAGLGLNFINVDNVDFNGFSDYYGGNPDVYSENSNISISEPYDNVTEKNKVIIGDEITFNATKIANNNTAYANASQVPQTTFNNSGESVTLPAKEMGASSSYYGNETAKLAVPYKLDSGTPINDSETVIISTPSNGIQSYAEPVNYPRLVDLMDLRNQISASTYTYAGNYGADVWNNYLQTIVADPNETIFTANGGIDPELSQLSLTAPDGDNVDGVVGGYAGVYESTASTTDDVITVTEQNSGDQYKGYIFSTNMTKLMEQTSEVGVVNEGDSFNVSVTNRTFIVDSETAQRHDLNGTVTVDLIKDKDSTQTRTYDDETTNLSSQAERLETQKKVIEKTIIQDPGSGGGGLDLGGNTGLIVGIIALGLVVIASRDNNN